nr:hypothetical protein [Tanacetum cinerariifolium]
MQSQRATTIVKQSLLPTPPPPTTVNPSGKPLAIKWISPAERQERLSKGLCFNYDNKWVRGHKCPDKFLLVMVDDDVDADTVSDGEAMEGQLHILIDNGSTHNFVHPEVLKKIKLPITTMKQFKVYIGSGETLLCENLRSRVKLDIQGLSMEVDLYTMEFILWETRYTLQGDESLRIKRISLHHIRALLETEEVYGIYELYNLASPRDEQEHAQLDMSSEHPEITLLLSRFASLFQVPSTLPPHRSINHHIHLLSNTKPINVRPYRHPHYQKGGIGKLVNDMLSQWIICISQSTYSSPVLLVKGKYGSYRFCVDYRELNEVTVKDKFLIPTTYEIFDELGGATIFTKLNLCVGHHKKRVHERDMYKTAFRTHDQHYEFLGMSFELTNTSSTFQATMNRATLTAHLEYLQCVFQCLHDHQFYVKQSKCVFDDTSLEYLGHIITGYGAKMDPKKVVVVVDWPVPTTQRHIREFWGLAGYYQRFLKKIDTIFASLSGLFQKQGFKWGGLDNKAFEDLNTRLSEVPILGLPNFKEEFVVETDYLDVAIGAVLMQKG